ncbi:hypothetical protein J3459_012369 [Metarhizium acridum]|nr:hypothetical protein J3459_012369 [Metarhizium acridum]
MTMHHLVELVQEGNTTPVPVDGVARDRLCSRVIVRLVRNQAATKGVVANDQTARAQQPVGLPGLGSVEYDLQIRGVAGLLRIDEDDIIWLWGFKPGQTATMLRQ